MGTLCLLLGGTKSCCLSHGVVAAVELNARVVETKSMVKRCWVKMCRRVMTRREGKDEALEGKLGVYRLKLLP